MIVKIIDDRKSSERGPYCPHRALTPVGSGQECPCSLKGFTLLEMLTVIAIIGILAAIAIPNLGNFKPNVMAAGTRQLLDDLARARQLAISQRTTVYMVFVPTNFWAQPGVPYGSWTSDDVAKSTNLWGKQLIGYNFVTMRSLGDQPGSYYPRYLSSWRTLPEGVIILPQKFAPFNLTVPALSIYTNGNPLPAFEIAAFQTTNSIRFPAETTTNTPYVTVPFIAFNSLGQLVDAQNNPIGRNEYVPLALGNVSFPRDANKKPLQGSPTITESPAGNGTNNYNIVSIDWLTGRARVERREVQ